jgi:hypothetical protein
MSRLRGGLSGCGTISAFRVKPLWDTLKDARAPVAASQSRGEDGPCTRC